MRKISDEDLSAAWLAGETMGEMAERFGRTRSSIAGAISRARARGVSLPARAELGVPRSSPKPRRNKDGGAKRLWLRRLTSSPVRRRGELFEPEMMVDLLDLEPNHCRWPIGDPAVKMMFCGLDKSQGSSYCPMHRAQGTKPRRGVSLP